jgi:C-terminal processing protease CtpA/Prc
MPAAHFPLFHPPIHPPTPHCTLQASTTGINESVYRPGVRLGEIRESTVAGQAGLRRGDVVLKVGDLLVAPRPGAVNDVVNAIK